MTMPKKGTRTIRTDDDGNFGAAVIGAKHPKSYRWSCRIAKENPHVYQDVDLVVEEAVEEGETPGRPLLARVCNVETIDNGIVARVIKAARAEGWDPSGRKANYRFEYLFTSPSALQSLRDFAKA
jgi:hypothetical protein